MVLDEYQTVELILDSNSGEVRGRTAIQKLVYLSKVIIPELNIPPYKPHYYGPYSPGLSLALEKMVSYSFLDEIRIPGSMYDAYTYKLTTDGQEIANEIKQSNQQEYEKINELVKVCKKFSGLKSTPLSYAAKAFYMVHSQPGKKLTYDDAVNYAKNLGWQISEREVEQGAQLLEKLKLVTIS